MTRQVDRSPEHVGRLCTHDRAAGPGHDAPVQTQTQAPDRNIVALSGLTDLAALIECPVQTLGPMWALIDRQVNKIEPGLPQLGQSLGVMSAFS